MMTSSAHLAAELGALLGRFYLMLPDLPGQSVRGLPIGLPYTDESYARRLTSLILIVPAGIAQGSLVKGFTKMALSMILYKIHPTEKRLCKLATHLITTWDEDWARYLGDSFNDYETNLKIPPVASDEELENLNMACLVIGADDDILQR